MTNPDDVAKMYKQVTVTRKDGTTYQASRIKTLQELADDGILTVSHSTLKHSTVGEYSKLGNPKKPPSVSNGGRPSKGGHGQSAIIELESKGFSYNIEKTFENGVRVGNIPIHTDKYRRSGIEHSWFPETWSDDDILLAGTYVANNPAKELLDIDNQGNIIRKKYVQVFNDVFVIVSIDSNGSITTIYPQNTQSEV